MGIKLTKHKQKHNINTQTYLIRDVEDIKGYNALMDWQTQYGKGVNSLQIDS